MADEADRASEIIEASTAQAVEACKRGPFAGIRPRGFCIWCGDPVDPYRLHCRPVDNDCEGDHLKYMRFRGH